VVHMENADSGKASTRAGVVQKLNVDTSGGNGLGGVTFVHNASGQISSIFAGDLKGKMWKFVYNSATASKFEISGGAPLFAATDSTGSPQSITSSPAIFNHAQGGYIVIFGTGKLFSTADSSDTSTQSVYGIWDKPSDSLTRPLVRSQVSQHTLSSFTGTGGASGSTFYSMGGSPVDWTSQRGYVVDLGPVIPGGRVIYPTQILGYDFALLSSVAPVQGTPADCDSMTGTGLNLALPVQSGLNPPNHTLDTNGDGVADASDSYAVAYATKADGIDAVIQSKRLSGGGSGSGAGCASGQTCVRTIGTTVDLSGGGTGGGGVSTAGGASSPSVVTKASSTQKADNGGGIGEQDCTGADCSSKGRDCVPSPLCTEANTCLSLIQSATTGITVCIDAGTPPPVTPVVNPRSYDRVWRRIINPPIK